MIKKIYSICSKCQGFLIQLLDINLKDWLYNLYILYIRLKIS